MTHPEPDPHPSLDTLYALLLELRADSLSTAQQAELNQLLANDAALREAAVDFLMDEASLIHELRTDECRELFQDSGMVAGLSATPSSAQPSAAQRSPAATPTAPVTSSTASVTAPTALAPPSRVRWYALMCAATALGFAWGMVTRGVPETQPAGEQITQPDPPPAAERPPVCATLTLDAGCEWESAVALGAHFYPGTYQLNHGVAGLHLTDGTRLFVEGPACFEIRTSRYIVLTSGHVLAEVSEEAVGFRLETPTTSVVDVGTAFEVSVDSAGSSELEVIEGAVTLLPGDSAVDVNPPLIFSGDVRTIAGTDSAVTGKQPQTGFRRRLDALLQSRPDTELIAFDGFDSASGDDGYINSGTGWKSPWLLGWNGRQPASVVLREGRNIDAPLWLPPPSASYVVCPTGSVSRRLLAAPLDMSVDQTYYISFLLRTRGVGIVNQRQTGSGLRISSSAHRDTGFGVCIDWQQHLTTWSGDQRWRGELLMENDRSFLIVLRITASADEPDRVHALSFPADSLPSVVEPEHWQSWCTPHAVDRQLDTISLWSGQSAVSLVDELRVGTSWPSVVPVR